MIRIISFNSSNPLGKGLVKNNAYPFGMRLGLFFCLSVVLLSFSCDTDDEEPLFEEDIQGQVATYGVSGNTISLITDHQHSSAFYADQSNHQFLWSFFSELIPVEARPQVVEFELFADSGDDTEAFVSPISDNDLSRWELGFNLTTVWSNTRDFQKSRVAYNSIHEYAHIMTLNNEQVDAGGSESTCQNFFTGEGCSTTASYINVFFNNYWTDIYDESQSFDVEDDDAFFAFYDKYADRFVSEYASTNPGEDIAESFTMFVLTNMPTGNLIKDEKVRFFYEYQELIALRDEIRSNIDFQIDFNHIGEARIQKMKQARFEQLKNSSLDN